MKKTKVYIDTFYYSYAISGIKSYINELVSATEQHGASNIQYFFSHNINKNVNKYHIVNSKFRIIRMIFHLRYFIYKQLILPIKVIFNRCDFLICPDYISPLFCSAKKITVIHDNFFWKYPNNYSLAWRKYFIAMIKLGLISNSQIVTTSNYSLSELQNIFRNKKISYIYQSFEKNKLKLDLKLNFRYILSVGTFDKRKNLLTLLKAYSKIRNDLSEIKLVLVGETSPNGNKKVLKNLKKYIKNNDLENDVVIKGYLKRDLVNKYFFNALMYVFPSKEEGFGIPLLEAMDNSLPIICSDIPVFREIGRDSVVYFKDQDHNDLANKIAEIQKNNILRNLLIKKSQKRVKDFNKKKFISSFEKLY